ncbi:hypothetical protein [Nocardia arizonensis]|uniref:hypothetical protein n=1 Tax=Nocardia arizonensis TaxID=1141647 RepID=UPI0006D1F8AC|nr:hypothetical protein [Nocardia arizonensis]
MAYGNSSMHRPKGRISVADIAAQPGGIEALQRRVHELRSKGVDFAANAIEQEMADLDLPSSEQPSSDLPGS